MKKVMLIAFAVLSVTQAHAEAIWCTGTIDAVYVTSTGDVNIRPQWRNGGYVEVCNIKATWKGVDPVTCATWFALAGQAVKSRQPTIMMYSAGETCASVPTYDLAPPPYYIMNQAN